MPNAVVTSVFSSRIPRFIYGIDQEENEYVLCTSTPQYLIKFQGVVDVDLEGDEEDEEEDESDLLEPEGQEGKTEFHIEIFKFTSSGLTPITYESKVKAVQDLIKDALAFYLEIE